MMQNCVFFVTFGLGTSGVSTKFSEHKMNGNMLWLQERDRPQ